MARLTNPSTTGTTTTANNVALNYFSFLGGTGNDGVGSLLQAFDFASPHYGQAITVDSASGALITGWTQSPDLLVLNNSIQSALDCPSGAATPCQDAFAARLNTATVVGQTTGSWVTYFGGSGTDQGTSIALDVNQNAYFAGDTNSTDFPVSKPLQPTNGGGYDAFVTQLGTAVTLSVDGALTLGTNQSYISAGIPATFTYTVTNSGPDLANNITLLDNLNPSITGVPLTFQSASTSAGTCGGGSTNAVVSCSLPSLQAGSTATVTVVVIPTANGNGQPGSFNGGSVQVTGPGNIVLAQTSVPAQMSDFSLAGHAPLITASPWPETRRSIKCNSRLIPCTSETFLSRVRDCLRHPRATSPATPSRCKGPAPPRSTSPPPFGRSLQARRFF